MHNSNIVIKDTGIHVDKEQKLDIAQQKISIRIGAEEARYRAQFNTLDALLVHLRSMNGYLTRYLAVLSEKSHAKQ